VAVKKASQPLIDAVEKGLIPLGRSRETVPIGVSEEGILIGKDGPFPMRKPGEPPAPIAAAQGKVVAFDGGGDDNTVMVESSLFTIEDLFLQARDYFEKKKPGPDIIYEMRLDELAATMGGFVGFHKLTARVTLTSGAGAGAKKKAS
jgi:hypothetical protein